jgi:Complex 1 protein (LYR family)
MSGGPTRTELLMLYRRLLRSASTYPSKKRTSIYQAIRDEWREDAKLNPVEHNDKIQERITVAYKGLSQLRQFDVKTMTSGNTSSPNWSVTLEQNPMPKPDNYDDKVKGKKLGR